MLTINNTIDGAIQDIEIKGNTVQNPDNLADIKSVGELQEDGTYKMSISSCGKNLFNIIEEPFKNNGNINLISYDNNSIVASLNEYSNWAYIKVPLTNLKPNTDYVFSYNISTNRYARVYQGTSAIDNTISGVDSTKRKFNTSNYTDLSIRFFVTTDNGENGEVTFSNIQLEEGTQATSYEPYQENKCDILLPCQLEKVGDVSDRLYYDDVEKAWCIEKNIRTIVYNGTESWISDGSTELNNKFRVTGYIGDSKSISNLFLNTSWDKYNTASGTEFISTASSVKTVHVSVLKSKCPTLQSFKEFLGTNNLIIKTD